MARYGSKIHKWTDDELSLLVDTIREAAPMLDHYKRQGYNQVDWWASVSGMLFQKGGPIVTGKACARQFDLILDRENNNSEVQSDKWESVSKMIEDYEQSILEIMEKRMERIEKKIGMIAIVVDTVARDLGISETWE